MVGNVTTHENGIEQMLKGFASIAGIRDLIEGLAAQITALRSEIAELQSSALPLKAKPPEWLKLHEAAAQLNTSPKTVRRYIERGLLRKNAASRHILIPAEDVAGLQKRVTL